MTKRIHLTLAIALSMPIAGALAQAGMGGMKDMEMGTKPAAGAAATHKASATVTKVDREADTVTLAHGPIASLKWPAMTMAFKVRDKQLFDKFVVGRRVDVELVQDGKDYAVTAVK